MQRETEDKIELTIFDGRRERRLITEIKKPLLEVFRENGVYFNAPCSGRGVCGKCLVTLVAGHLSVMDAAAVVARCAEPGETVLACRSALLESCRIDISEATERGFAGSSDILPRQSENPDNGYETLRFVPGPGSWENAGSVSESICQGLGRRLDFSHKALRQLSCWMATSLQQNHFAPDSTSPVWLTVRDSRALHVRTAEDAPLYGIGVDIGTTTIAFALVDLATGVLLNSVTLLNSQRQYGADVISRSQKAAAGFGDALRECLRSDLARGIDELCRQETEAVVRLVIAGNPTMLHLLLGLRPDSLAIYPFTALTRSQISLSTAELFGVFPVDCEAVMLPCLAAYAGADLVAGMLHCRLDSEAHLTLLVDLGTNGELAIGDGERILCTSTAAGPAFEGANISCGVGSVTGAISRFDIRDGKVLVQTIGEASPIGICGSGVLDIVAVGLRERLIDRTGRLQVGNAPVDSLEVGRKANGEAIVFNQKDIREFQLAKAAIRSGLEILLREYGRSWTDVGRVFIAGGFGAGLDVNHAVAVGLLPVELRQKLRAVGNSALGGTVDYLLYSERREAVKKLQEKASYIDLSRHPSFNDLFIAQLDFAPME